MISARSLIESVNTGDTLTQEELFPLFSRASFLVYDCIRLLIRENIYIQLGVIGLGAEVASNLDRNKAIYRRSVDFVDGVLKDIPADVEQREANFLCACMNLQRAIAVGDIEQQLDLVLELPLTRMVFEQVVKDWYTKASSYLDASKQSLNSKLQDLEDLDSDTKLFFIEQSCAVDAHTAYGVIRYIGNRLNALRSLYDRIFNAYARVILKLAKAQAVSEDHVLDCTSNGSLGLLRAISSYDHVSNARFVGHARWWIRQSMLYYLKEDSNLIRVSSNTWQHYAKLESIRLSQESQSGPLSNEDLSKVSGYSKSHVDTIYNTVRASQVRSLDYPIRTDNPTSTGSIVETYEESDDPLDYNPTDSVNVLLDSLPNNLRNVVCLAYGLTEYVTQQLDPVKVEAERIRQLAVL